MVTMWLIITTLVLIVVAGSAWGILEYRKRSKPGISRRQLDLTLAALTQKIRKDSRNPVLYAKRGLVLYKKHHLKSALNDFDHAVDLDKESTVAHYHRGILLQKMGNPRRARRDFEWIRENSEDPFYKTAVADQLRKLDAG